ncbi:hypothetical protein PQR05_29385 [Paraburkholderia sediminicola]|uniref:hypothetical protein n=1 Tax=Paraburkholderia sediminicola TaxID=458836 RepID=UPI0038BA6D1F
MNQQERMLTGAAAMAAGISLQWSSEPDMPPRRSDTWEIWNPRDDGNDALHLMIALDMRAEPGRTMHGPIDRVTMSVKGKRQITETVMYDGDPPAAWRLAILLTAAALEADK